MKSALYIFKNYFTKEKLILNNNILYLSNKADLISFGVKRHVIASGEFQYSNNSFKFSKLNSMEIWVNRENFSLIDHDVNEVK